MNSCVGNSSVCDGRDILPVRFGISHRERLLCAACREIAIGMGLHLTVVERRVADVPVEQERRGFRPRWLSRLTAKDLTEHAA